jgi:ribosomal protein S13
MRFKVKGIPEVNEMVKNLGIKSDELIKNMTVQAVDDIKKDAKKTLAKQSVMYDLTENMDMKATQNIDIDIRRYHWKRRQFWRT